MGSEAVAEIATAEPETVELLVGEVIETVGEVVSGTGMAEEQLAVVPPLLPTQFQRYWVAESVVSEKLPAVQEFRAMPHWPLIGLADLVAVQATVEPPFEPIQLQELWADEVGLAGIVGVAVPKEQ